MMSFKIRWDTDEEEWLRARQLGAQHQPGSEFDEGLQALDGLLVGSVWFARCGTNLKPVGTTDPREADPKDRKRPGGTGARSAHLTHLFQGFDLPLGEFAWQLAVILDQEGFEAAPEGSAAEYQMMDDALALQFRKIGESVEIYSNEARDQGWMLVVPEGEFFSGVRSFLNEVAGSFRANAPELLRWSTFAPLIPFLETPDASL